MAGIPAAKTFISVQQATFDDFKFDPRVQCFREVLLGVSLVCESDRDALRVLRLHIKQRTNLGSGKASLAHVLLRVVAPV